jgi:outer membrane protein assembly factor BamB
MLSNKIKFIAFLLILSILSCSTDKSQQESTSTAKAKIQEVAEFTPGSGNWLSFRGESASGVADGQNLPDHWNGDSLLNISIPGLAHSSPVVWGEKLFVTSAISSQANVSFRHGLYGDGDASDDLSVHRWQLFCLKKHTGEILWQQTAYEGVPKERRHIKATYANSTPVTDGRYVVAFFGSHGLYAFDLQGTLLWEKDLGRLDVGAYGAPSYEWGSASSPIIWQDLVIVQCDTQQESFILACDLKTGETVWKTLRDELPSWGTPTIYPGADRLELITNGSNYIRGYAPDSGEELWRLGGSSKITAPTPVFAKELIVVTSGRGPERPIFAIRPGAVGDITLKKNQTSSEFVAWSKIRRGPYMPTPIIYRGLFYTLLNQGILDCYDLKTGEEIYRQRIKHSGGGFSASPVAADGKIYLAGEDGDIFVVQSGPEYKLIATNSIGERLMASPALSEGKMYVRAEKHLFAVGQ